MQSLIVNKYMSMIETLSVELKLELLSQLSENIKNNFSKPSSVVDEERLLEQLSGSWEDMDDSVVKDMLSSRSTSLKDIDLEQ